MKDDLLSLLHLLHSAEGQLITAADVLHDLPGSSAAWCCIDEAINQIQTAFSLINEDSENG